LLTENLQQILLCLINLDFERDKVQINILLK
jgi:hypothetical protein